MKNQSRTKFHQWTTCALAFAPVLLVSPMVRAQPNPFDDYARHTHIAPNGTETHTSVYPIEFDPTIVTKPMTWSVGLRSQFAFSSMRYERAVGGQDGVARAALFRLSPSVGLFIYDRIQIGFSPGLLARSGGGTPGDSVTDAALLLEATVHYFAPVTPRLSFVPGIGLGGSVGRGERSIDIIPASGAIVHRSFATSTSALSVAFHASVAYQLTYQVQIRSGLFVNWFFSRDTLDGKSVPMRGIDTHIGIPIEVFYTF